MTSQPDDLAQRVLPTLLGLGGARKLIAVAGPPGAGKSTVSEALCHALNARGRRAVVVPMDGFHLDNRLLDAAGLRARKGAPETFDAAGFVHLISRIAGGDEVIYPVFDRARDIAIAGAARLDASVEFILVEGNYLLLDSAPWNALQRLWDYTIFSDEPHSTLEARLMDRWLSAGLSEAEARRRCDTNDLPNATLVKSRSVPADLTFTVS